MGWDGKRVGRQKKNAGVSGLKERCCDYSAGCDNYSGRPSTG